MHNHNSQSARAPVRPARPACHPSSRLAPPHLLRQPVPPIIGPSAASSTVPIGAPIVVDICKLHQLNISNTVIGSKTSAAPLAKHVSNHLPWLLIDMIASYICISDCPLPHKRG
ncbi:hypothetical protein IG631_16970 [Alternaria alternata]|nr:hypothetical protein IG631_16970 [Alternaria alternata]